MRVELSDLGSIQMVLDAIVVDVVVVVVGELM